MVSLQTTLNSAADPSKKRKREDDRSARGQLLSKELRLWSPSAPRPDIDLLLEDSPLPPEWQRCLDIKSGQITFYNTRTRTRTARDPRRKDPPSQSPVRLDLDLNLGSESAADVDEFTSGIPKTADYCKEMVAGVCMRCHMLVVMRRSSPACPNCKFVHVPPPTDSSALAKPGGFSLLCCRD